jgi:peroxiredoxin
MTDTAKLEIGQMAPDFRLKGPGGQFVQLSDYRGRRHVVLAFYPLAFSPTCSHQLPGIQERLRELRDAGAEVLGISVDSHWANEAFARKLGVEFDLLSDFKREASSAYGVLLGASGYSTRAIFVVDKQGKLVYKEVSANPDDIPGLDAVLDALRAAG